jgi:hypothetical protein
MESSPYQPPPPSHSVPKRGGTQWWVWLLVGCGACMLLGILGIVAAGVFTSRAVSRAMNQPIGPVTNQSVAQALAPVPVYPSATLDVAQTTQVIRGMSIARAIPGVKGMFSGQGVYTTADPAQTVLAWYDKKMTALRWTVSSSGATAAGQQRQYQQGSQVAVVQTSASPGGTQITLMKMTLPAGAVPPAGGIAPPGKQ